MSETDIKHLIEQAERLRAPSGTLETTTLTTLMGKEFEPISWIVPELLPEGLTLMVGSPKIGKSWLALSLCQSVAFGGYAINGQRVIQGTVLYLALEDNERRLQARFNVVCQDGVDQSEQLHFVTQIERMDHGGLDKLMQWLDEHPDCRLVVIDTLQKFRPCSNGGNETYGSDYLAITPLQQLAIQRRIAIVLVHHTRKADASDPFDKVSGTTAITGASDCLWLLSRARGASDAKLTITGRDVEEHELAMKFDSVDCRWSVIGEAREIASSREEEEILDLLKTTPKSLGPREVSEQLGISDSAAKMRLTRMFGTGKIIKAGRGKYLHQDNPKAESHMVTQSHNRGVTGETCVVVQFPGQSHKVTHDPESPNKPDQENPGEKCDFVTLDAKAAQGEVKESHTPNVTNCDPVTFISSKPYQQLSLLNPRGD